MVEISSDFIGLYACIFDINQSFTLSSLFDVELLITGTIYGNYELKYGQLANRLFAFSHFIANAIEYDYKLINPTFNEYRKYFNSTSKNEFGQYSISLKYSNLYPLLRLLIPFIRKFFRTSPSHSFIEIQDNDSYDLKNDLFLLNSRNKIIMAYGWKFRDYINFTKHSQTIRNIFTPLPIFQKNVENLIRKCRTQSDVLIGVHIRRGDYQKWRDGKYYYDDSIYREKMMQMELHFSNEGKRTAFLVCSNDNLEIKNFIPLNINSGSNHFIEDLYALSRCDYIIGPPSTFSMWASFYNNVPLLHITDPNQNIDINKFKINNG